MSKLLETPITPAPGCSPKPSHEGNKGMNGVQKMPQRSTSKDSVPEVTYDNVGGKK